jgi:hypothetical protein
MVSKNYTILNYLTFTAMKTSNVVITALMMEAVQTSETSVNSHQSTQRYNPEDSHLHSHRREKLKSCKDKFVSRYTFSSGSGGCLK